MNEELQRLLDLEVSEFQRKADEARQEIKHKKSELAKISNELANKIKAKNILLGIKVAKKSYRKKKQVEIN